MTLRAILGRGEGYLQSVPRTYAYRPLSWYPFMTEGHYGYLDLILMCQKARQRQYAQSGNGSSWGRQMAGNHPAYHASTDCALLLHPLKLKKQ